MANQPGRSQPFRFWFPWTGAAPQQRPPVRQPLPRPPPSTPSQPPAQPQAQSKPPALSQSQTALQPQRQSPSPTTRKPSRTPSPSPVPSPSRRSSLQPPSPSLRPPSPSSSASQTLPLSQTETKMQSRTPVPSRSPSPSLSQDATESLPETQPQREPETQQPEPPANSKPKLSLPTDSQPQTTTQAQTQIQEHTQIQNASEEKQLYSPDTSAATQQRNDRIEAEETTGGTPQTSLEAKQLAQSSKLPEEEEKPREVPEDKPKPHPEVKQTMTLTKHPESKTVADEIRNDKAEVKPEAQQAMKTSSGVNGVPEKSMECPNSSPTKSDLDVSELATDLKILIPGMTCKQAGEMQNGDSGHERDIAVSTVPRATHPHGERGNFQAELQEGISKLTQKLNIGRAQQPGNGNAVNIITLAGENKGASMVIGYETSDREEAIHIRRGHKLNKEIGMNNLNNGGQKEKRLLIDHENEAMNANINSNVQSINNSILHDSKCNEKYPGVHLVFSSKPIEDIKIEEKPESRETLKTTSSTSPAQKLAYEPNIRRRCLRGLFLESSEDDQENLQKPRRHGCRFSCDEKKKGKVDLAETATTNSTNHSVVGTSRA